ncbi:MAG: dTDP-4-dehydrorhamnose 3,5-epimerase [Ignavibacteriaceae bacterium]|nr:dTDP-4-dehydrorhamnose 3,5-epimerase [Ignavibacteriaceae bacterium]
MKVVESALNGILVIEPSVFTDIRGYFFECFQAKKLASFGITAEFTQDNISKSVKNTVRGLHYQVPPSPQGKLCQVVFGEVVDVVVDIRHGSPTFGKYFSTHLSEENHRLIWIPPGFAHGFSVISETVLFHYKCTGYYNKEDERVIRFDDPVINVNWEVTEPIVSPKDLDGINLKEIEKDFIFK